MWGTFKPACLPMSSKCGAETGGAFLSVGWLGGLTVPVRPPSQPTDKKAPPVSAPHFEDIGRQAGLNVPHISSPDKRYIVESVSGGIGLIDCDGDGKLDIIAVNGSNVDRYRRQGGDPMVTLYHQDADLKFSDITGQAGLTHQGWGMGV